MTRWKLIAWAAAGMAASLFATASFAEDPRIYVFSSGPITIGKGILQNLAPVDPPIQVPVGFYVIKHPKGNIVFDTGNNDRIITDPGYWGDAFKVLKPVNTPDVAIDVQLKKIGLTPDDIKYVIPSHLHWDHGGNIGKFPNSTIVVQKAEVINAFWPEVGTGDPYLLGDVAPLRNKSQKVLQLDGDLDLFGDGSVLIKKFVGHTPGSQVAQVRLKNTGIIVLTGDSLYFRENLEKNIPPNIVLAYDPAGIYKFYDWLRKLVATEKADYFSAHDPDSFKALKKPPQYYD